MDAQQIQAIHSLIDDLQEAAEDLPDPAEIESGDPGDQDQDPTGDGAGAGDGTDPDADAAGFDFQASASEPFTAEIEAATEPEADADGLRGIVWASGTHDLWVNGEAERVHVPEETISETFRLLQQRMEAEGVKIGFDHPDPDSVAAQTALGEIGEAQEFVQASDGERETIVMRESEFTNSKAVEAAEADAFEGMGFSIVGNIALATDEDGNPIEADDGGLQVAGTEIQRVDVVPDQAVEGAKHGNLPDAAAAATSAGRLAAGSPNQAATKGFVRTLRAAASAGGSDANVTMSDQDTDFPTDPDSLEAAQNALNQASDVVEAKQDQIEDLEAQISDLEEQADHFEQIAAAHGIDADADDFEAQQVIDAHTEDLREEIAELEAALPKYETDPEDQDERIEELAGSSITELKAKNGELWREYGQVQANQSDLNAAVAAQETIGGVESAGSGDGSGSDADEAAQEVLTARELMEANQSDQSPSEFVQANFGVDPQDYSDPQELQAKISGGAE